MLLAQKENLLVPDYLTDFFLALQTNSTGTFSSLLLNRAYFGWTYSPQKLQV